MGSNNNITFNIYFGIQIIKAANKSYAFIMNVTMNGLRDIYVTA